MRLPHIATALAAALVLIAATAGHTLAHHYFANFKQQDIVLRGTVVDAYTGNPHGVITVEADGVQWDAYLGAANHSQRLGLSDEMFERGSPIVVYGHPSVDDERRELMTIRFIYDGVTYEVFHDIDER